MSSRLQQFMNANYSDFFYTPATSPAGYARRLSNRSFPEELVTRTEALLV